MIDPTSEIMAAIIALCTDDEGESKITTGGSYWQVIEDILDKSGNNNYILLDNIRLEENENYDEFIHDVLIEVNVICLTNNDKKGFGLLETVCTLFTQTVIKQDLEMDNFAIVVKPYVTNATRFPKEKLENGKIEYKKTYEIRLTVQQI